MMADLIDRRALLEALTSYEEFSIGICKTILSQPAIEEGMNKPLTLEELEQSVWKIPCWVEERGGALFPEVLDRDSVGYFGRIDAAHDRPVTYYLKSSFNKTWRCWLRKPTDAEREDAPWEVG